MSKLIGRTVGLKPNQQKRLLYLYRRTIPANEVVTVDLARHMAHLSHEIGRQLGIIVDRRGSVTDVLVGDAGRISYPDALNGRRGGARLSGRRFIYTQPKPVGLTRNDLTMLAHNRWDAIISLEVKENGGPGIVEVGYLLPENPDNKHWEKLRFSDPSRLDIDFQEFIKALEEEFARSFRGRETPDAANRAILVMLSCGDTAHEELALAEFQELARTSGVVVLDTAIQRRKSADSQSVIGKGKLEEVTLHALQMGADVLIFDRDLTPAQVRYISEATGLNIIDRTQLILDIFAQHAHSRDGKIQVELAQLNYLLPRLRNMQNSLSRLTGGIGARGPGETKLEIDRRRIRDRITRLEKDLEHLSRARNQRRQSRRKENIPIISIVGYTNAGKSTLLNSLTRSRVAVEDKYFATLDTSSRRLRFPRERDTIITDTVGFIRDLPPDLMKAFRATLEELKDADLLLHVVDISNPHFSKQMAAVDQILGSLELDRVPRLLVFNKKDLVSNAEIDRVSGRYGGLAVSAATGEGLENLTEEISKLISWSQRTGDFNSNIDSHSQQSLH